MPARAFKTQQKASKAAGVSSQLDSQRRIENVELTKLRPAPCNARQHSKKQVRQIAESIKRFGFNNPLILDDNWNIVAGHGRHEAAKLLHMASVPVVRLSHLSEAELRAYRLADNRLAESAAWDQQLLAVELRDLEVLLPQLGLDLGVTGFEPLERESCIVGPGQPPNPPEKDLRPNRKARRRHGTQGRQAPARMAGNELAEMAFADPYKVQIGGQARARGDCGERADAIAGVVQENLRLCAHHRPDGSVDGMNCRHLPELVPAGAVVYHEQKNLFAWIRNNTGPGTV
jgi:hypothetical protein